MYLSRDISRTLQQALASMPVVVLSGMRQVGKSTLLQRDSVCAGRRYFTLDDFATLESAKRDPDRLLSGNDPITIDEVQRCPEIFIAAKRLIDRSRRPGKLLLSGSANIPLLNGIAESLAGRAVYLTLSPFTRRELVQARGRSDEPFILRFARAPACYPDQMPTLNSLGELTRDEILLGGMPSVRLGDVAEPRFWFTGFEQTYLERDVRNLSLVADLISFRHLLGLAALRTGQLVKISELARDAKLSTATAGRYLDLLEASFVTRRVTPFLGNRASRLVKSPKLYLSDSGLAAHMIGAGQEVPQPFWGALTETYVAQNLFGILEAWWPEAKLHFWNIQSRYEVDFIIEAGRTILAIEVKSAARWNDRDLSGLRAFLSATPACTAALLAYSGPEFVSLGDKLWAVPLSMLLS